jgi:hypothetical protein
MTCRWKLYAGIVFTIPLLLFIIKIFGAITVIIFLYLAFGWSKIGFIFKPNNREVEQLIIKNRGKRYGG